MAFLRIVRAWPGDLEHERHKETKADQREPLLESSQGVPFQTGGAGDAGGPGCLSLQQGHASVTLPFKDPLPACHLPARARSKSQEDQEVFWTTPAPLALFPPAAPAALQHGHEWTSSDTHTHTCIIRAMPVVTFSLLFHMSLFSFLYPLLRMHLTANGAFLNPCTIDNKRF